MKTILLFVLLLSVSMINGQKSKCGKPESSENNQKILVLDPFGEDKLNASFSQGEFIKFKIKNVNIFKVSGYTKTSSSNITFDFPKDIFANIQTISNNPNSFEEGYKKTLKKKKSIINSHKKEQDFAVVYKKIVSDLQKIKSYMQLEEKLLDKLSDSVFVRECIVKDLAKSDYNATYDKVEMDAEDKKIVINTLKSINENYLELSKIYNEINKDKLKNSIVKVSGKLQSKDNNTLVEIKDATLSQNNELKFSKEMNEIETGLKKIKSDSANVIKITQAGIDLFHKIDKSEFAVYTAPQQLNDNINVITPELRNSKGKVIYTYNPITIRTYHSWKVDFSAGYFLSFIGNDNYSSFSNSSGEKRVVAEEKNKITNALGGLMHVYRLKENPNHWFPQFGLSFGASLSDNTNIGFYGGFSFFFLEKNRLVFTSGYSFIKIKKINKANLFFDNEHKNYAFTNSTDTDIRYDDLYKGAIFLGVTYNLSSGDSKGK